MVTLTEEAQKKVSELLSQETEDMALRVAVRPGGCSGFSYEMYFDTDKAEDDIEKLFDEVRVVVDSSSAELLTCLLYTSPSPRDRG